LMSDMKTSTKDNKLDYRIQQYLKGSSEGSGIVPEFPDELKDISGSSSNSFSGSDDEVEDVSSDDKIKADENKANAEVTMEQAGEEHPVDDQARIEQARCWELPFPNLVPTILIVSTDSNS
ncbi:hypothetical protein Tco_0203295, partial [Tanacetum coccineum]